MDEILENVKSLDIVKLREKLLEMGINVGPITPTTQGLFQKRLAKALFEESAGHVNDSANEEDSKNVSSETVRNVPKLDSASEVFYAVSLPEIVDPQISVEVNQLVFSDKDLALKTAKKVKGSRFKVFRSQKDAEEFSKLTAEHTFNSPMKVPKPEEGRDELVSTESIPYKAPKPQDLVQVRRLIEKGDVKLFLDCVWNNPRYLVSNGDTPVIYQEGFRYTAMHVAALKNQPQICRVILDTLEDPRFVQQLYCQSRHTENSLNNRINFIVDLYLNMPDKGNCESPLHMACKFGFDEVVTILAAHSKTDKLLKNRYGEMPKDLICSRSYNALTSTISRIEELLQGQYYVPLIRSVDNSTLPVIGQPWSHDISQSPVAVKSMPSPMSPRDPVLSVKACAGPMSPSFASDFHKKWTTPPSEDKEKARQYLDSKRGDSEKGMERIGRYLAHEMQIPWIEHWDFLDSYADLSTADGLDILEEYFKKTVWHSFMKEFKDMHGIEELFQELTELSTPVKAEGCDSIDSKGITDDIVNSTVSKENGVAEITVSKNLNSVFGSATGAHNSPVAEETISLEMSSENNSTLADRDKGRTDFDTVKGIEKTESKEKDSIDSKNSPCDSPESSRKASQLGNEIVSPITSLSQQFAQLSVRDCSRSDKVNNNTFSQNDAITNSIAEIPVTNNSLKDENQNIDSDVTKVIKADIAPSEKNLLLSKSSESKSKEDMFQPASEIKGKTQAGDSDKNKVDNSKTARNIIDGSSDVYKSTEQRDQETTGKGITSDAFVTKSDTKLTVVAEKSLAILSKTENNVYNNIKDKVTDKSEEQINTSEDAIAENKVNNIRDTAVEKSENKIDTTNSDAVKKSLNNKSDRKDVEINIKAQPTTTTNDDDSSVSPDSVERQHLLSERSDSTASYKTAEEDFYDCSAMSPFSDDGAVCIKLSYSQFLDRLKEEIDIRRQLESELDTEPVYLLVRHKQATSNGSLKFDIVLYPTTDSVNEILLIENLDVLSYDGNISGVSEGEVIDVCYAYRGEEVKLKAHFTRTDNLPKPAYIHGLEPTKEDLDVCRALGNALISPETHPNVFHWKINLNKFCADKKYRWQSPAKVKARSAVLQSPPPLASPQRTRSPAVPYGSPIGYSYEKRKILVSSDIRTTLFPSIHE